MRCEKCGGSWIPPKDRSKDLDKCPFCDALIFDVEKTKKFDIETAKKIVSFTDFLQYVVSVCGADIYQDTNKLYNYISDLYVCDERQKRIYRRVILEDMLPLHIYELYHTKLNERKFLYNQIVSQFLEKNFYPIDLGKQIVDDFVCGLQLKIVNSTIATVDDGKWIDEFGVVYSTNREKLIQGNSSLKKYRVRKGTLIICDKAFYRCSNLSNIKLPKTLEIIGSKAFDYTKLSYIYLPNSLKKIDGENFSDFDLKYIGIPKRSSDKFKSLINPLYHFKIKEGSLLPILLKDKINSLLESESVGCWGEFILYVIYLTINCTLYYYGYLDVRGLGWTGILTSVIVILIVILKKGLSFKESLSFIAFMFWPSMGFIFFSMLAYMMFDLIFVGHG